MDFDADVNVDSDVEGVAGVLGGVETYIRNQGRRIIQLEKSLKSEKGFSTLAVGRIIDLEEKANSIKNMLEESEKERRSQVEEIARLKAKVEQLGKMTVGSTIGTFSERDLKRLCQHLHPDKTGRDTSDLFRIFKGKLDGIRK